MRCHRIHAYLHQININGSKICYYEKGKEYYAAPSYSFGWIGYGSILCLVVVSS